MGFSEKYTTQDLILKDPKEQTKIILSNDKYAELEVLEQQTKDLAFALRKRND